MEQNLQSLMDRLKSGRYRALPVRRHYIDKSDGGKRALGIPSFEEKVAQRVIALLMEPIYEQDFRSCSFGFRPGRNAHQALQVIRRGIMQPHSESWRDLECGEPNGAPEPRFALQGTVHWMHVSRQSGVRPPFDKKKLVDFMQDVMVSRILSNSRIRHANRLCL